MLGSREAGSLGASSSWRRSGNSLSREARGTRALILTSKTFNFLNFRALR